MSEPTTTNADGVRWAMLGLVIVLIVCIALILMHRSQGAEIAQLRADVKALQTPAPAPAVATAETPAPDPVPARPSAPRAAVRPTPHAAPAAPVEPAEAPKRWGTTDLDRAIAATPSVNLLEQAK